MTFYVQFLAIDVAQTTDVELWRYPKPQTCTHTRGQKRRASAASTDSIIATRTINAEVPQFNWILLIQKTLSR